MTPRQKDALLIIYNVVHEQGNSITYDMLGELMGISKTAAYEHVQNLIIDGFARHPLPGKHRAHGGLHLTKKGLDKVKSLIKKGLYNPDC